MRMNITNLFELSKYLATKSGQELRDALTYLSDFVLIVISALNNRLNFEDNFDCDIRTILIVSGIDTIIGVNTTKRVKEIRIRRIIDSTYYIVDKFGWYYNNSGQVILTCFVTGSPTSQLNVDIIVFY